MVSQTTPARKRFMEINPHTKSGERIPCRSSFTSIGLSRSLKSGNPAPFTPGTGAGRTAAGAGMESSGSG